MSEQMREQVQTALGGAYTIEREIDAGGRPWRLFVARSAELNRDVVVNVLSPEAGTVVDLARFKREISFAARLEDPTIVPILAWGDAGGLPYFTTPLVAGESLRDKKMPAERALVVLRDVARALAHAHGRGVLHRDLTADAVFLSGDDGAVVSGFGVACALDAALGRTQDPTVDHRTDIRAFGLLADGLVSGERRQSLASLIERCISPNPDVRPESASNIVTLLDDLISPSFGLLDQFWPTESATIDARREYYRTRLVFVLVGIVIVGAVIGVLTLRNTFSTRAVAVPPSRSAAAAPSKRAPGPADSLARAAAVWLARIDSAAPPRDVAQYARDAIARGLTLDPGNPSLKFSEGVVAYLFDRDAGAALGYMRAAIAEDPDVPGATTWYPQVLWANGQRDTASLYLRGAIRRDSTSVPKLEAAWTYAHLSGDALRALQYCGALRQLRAAARCEAMQQVDVSRTDVALALTGQAATVAGDRNTAVQLDYIKVLVAARLVDSAKKMVAAVDRAAAAQGGADTYMRPDDIALMHGLIGDGAGALQWFARALADGSPGVGALYWRTVDNPVRLDPRLLEFANKAGLKGPPPYWP